MKPELSRPVRLDTLGESPRRLEIEADEAERAALARRFGFRSIESLTAEADISRNGAEVQARGRLRARVTQACVITDLDIETRVDESFDLRFRAHPSDPKGEEEIELSEAELDVIFHDGASIDLGEAVAETLPLSLDPYPRVAGAEETLKEKGISSEEEAGPFGALAALRDKMGK